MGAKFKESLQYVVSHHFYFCPHYRQVVFKHEIVNGRFHIDNRDSVLSGRAEACGTSRYIGLNPLCL